ncbi:uncharacterized [Tachysurus ichikawai]
MLLTLKLPPIDRKEEEAMVQFATTASSCSCESFSVERFRRRAAEAEIVSQHEACFGNEEEVKGQNERMVDKLSACIMQNRC